MKTNTVELSAVIENFRAGDMEALQVIYEKTKDQVFNQLCHMFADKQQAEDLLHDVYLRIYENRQKYDPSRAAIGTWIFRIAVNQAINHIRKQKWLGSNFRKIFDNDRQENHLEELCKNDEQKAIMKAMEKVRPDYKTCLILNYIEEKTYEEIADILVIKIGTVRSRINRGKKQLLKYYRKDVN